MADNNKETYHMLSNSQMESLTYDVSEKIGKLEELKRTIQGVWKEIKDKEYDNHDKTIEVLKAKLDKREAEKEAYKAISDLNSILQEFKNIKDFNSLTFSKYEKKVDEVSSQFVDDLKNIADAVKNMEISIKTEDLKKQLEKDLGAFTLHNINFINKEITNAFQTNVSDTMSLNLKSIVKYKNEISQTKDELITASIIEEHAKENLEKIYNNLNLKLKFITPVLAISIFLSGLFLGYGICHFENKKIISNFLNEK